MTAAIIFIMCTSFVVLFHALLLFGAPWGELALGGKYPGRIPLPARFIVALEIILLLLMLGVVMSHANWVSVSILLSHRYALWMVVGLNALSLLLHIITPSRRERMLWLPLISVQLACSATLALG